MRRMKRSTHRARTIKDVDEQLLRSITMASSSSSTRGKSDFKWTDDEAELLLNVTHNYKIAKITENVDWESVKTKYDNILALMKDELPSTADEAKEMTKDQKKK